MRREKKERRKKIYGRRKNDLTSRRINVLWKAIITIENNLYN